MNFLFVSPPNNRETELYKKGIIFCFDGAIVLKLSSIPQERMSIV